jgi:microcompartment protein CcmL/EutN
LAAAHIIARPHTEGEQILPVKASDVKRPSAM